MLNVKQLEMFREPPLSLSIHTYIYMCIYIYIVVGNYSYIMTKIG